MNTSTHHAPDIRIVALLILASSIVVGCCESTPASVAAVEQQRRVEELGGRYEVHLNFDFQEITDEDLARLELSPAVKSISLAYCPITDKGVADLKRATGLERLNLNGTRVTDGVVDHLRDMPSLVQAHFGTEEVSPEAQRELSDLLTARAALIAAELRKQPPLSATEQESSYGKK